MRTIRLVPIVLVLLLALWGREPASAALPTSPVDELLAMVNVERAAVGAPPLALRADLTEIAGAWSVTMAGTGVLAHNDGYFAADVRARIGPGARAENVAYAGDLLAVHRVLMDSPPHRANLLDGRYTVLGVGAVFDGRLWWVTQAFLAAPAAPAAATTTTTTTVVVAPALPEAEAPPLSVSLAAAPPAPAVAAPAPAPAPVAAPATEAPISVGLEVDDGPEPAPPTSTLASGEDPHPVGASTLPRTAVPPAAWVALLALAMSATGAVRASRAARA